MLTLTVDQKDQLLKNFQAYVEQKALADIKFDEVNLAGEPCFLIGYRYQGQTLCLFIFDDAGSYSISLLLLPSKSQNTFSKEFTDLRHTQILGLFTSDCPIANNKLIQACFKA
jgi:hypothetical protein